MNPTLPDVIVKASAHFSNANVEVTGDPLEPARDSGMFVI